MDRSLLRVGAGKAEIRFTDDMFPTFEEHYTHVHDATYTQTLILQTADVYAIVACGIVGIFRTEDIRCQLSELLNIPADHIIIHCKHVLTTPHCGHTSVETLMERSRIPLTEEEAKAYVLRDQKLMQAVCDSITQSAVMAQTHMQEARWGFGWGYSETNVNRVVYTKKGWWQGYNPEGCTDRRIPVLRFDNMQGEPIAILFGCNTAPGCMENSYLSDGRRPVSGDLAASAERYVDGVFADKVVSIYATGVTGDQWPAMRACLDILDEKGNQTVVDLHETGFVLTDLLGVRLGGQVLKAFREIETKPLKAEILLKHFTNSYASQCVSMDASLGPTTACEFTIKGTFQATTSILCIEDLAILFCGAEIDTNIYAEIQRRSPFQNTFLIEFSQPFGGGYLVGRDMYEKQTYQSRKTEFAAGSAEMFLENVTQALREMWNHSCDYTERQIHMSD